MKLVFIHGYSVVNLKTYGGLPEALVSQAGKFGLSLDIEHIFLGRYLSFYDEVTLHDIARALHRALQIQLGDGNGGIEAFSCITHSTGGPVARLWADMYYGAEKLDQLPMKHLIMLAPANHGSSLAQLGKGRLSRIKTWFQGVEPGQQVLNWLELGSEGQWALNHNFLDYDLDSNTFFPFVLTGQTIDKKLYDHLNSYTGERGTDGVIRVCGANLTYRSLTLTQGETVLDTTRRRNPEKLSLDFDEKLLKMSPDVPLGVIPGASHGGDKMGIQKSVSEENAAQKPVVAEILKCLAVNTTADYKERAGELKLLTETVQANDEHDRERYCMIIFNVYDDQGYAVTDFDMLLLAGRRYNEDILPRGFFVDRQRNSVSTNRLVYYLNYDRMKNARDGKMGMRIMARPDEGFACYLKGEFRSEEMPLSWILNPNEVIYVNIQLTRQVDEHLFMSDPVNIPGGRRGEYKPTRRGDFKRTPLSDKKLPPIK